jgi:pimeloyl-ACP methyl ester carboxylesterase
MPHVSANGIDLYYEESGSGESLLFLPPTGWPGSIWDLEQAPFFSKHYRVITFDQRGVGLSDKPDEQYTTELLARDALALLEALDAVPAHVFGFSVGGQSAQIMALEHPESIRSLILAGSNPGRPNDAPGLPLGLVVGMVTHGYGPGYWMHHLADSDFPFSPAFRAAHPEKLQALADTIEARKPPLKLYLRHVIARTLHDTSTRLSDIGVPTLIMVGAEDRGGEGAAEPYVDVSRAMAARIPNAELALVPRAHHLFAWEEPEETNRLALEFLQRH